MNFNYETLRKLLTDELYNTYSMQLSALETKIQINIMEDFMFNNFGIINIKRENNIQSINVLLSVSFKDYFVTKKGNIIRGNKDKIYNMTYKLTYVKTIDNKVNKCPNCGANIENKHLIYVHIVKMFSIKITMIGY